MLKTESSCEKKTQNKTKLVRTLEFQSMVGEVDSHANVHTRLVGGDALIMIRRVGGKRGVSS